MIKKYKYISLLALHKSGKIWWINSYPTLLNWFKDDLNSKNILKPIIKKQNKKTLYLFKENNIKKYVKAFEQGKL